MREFLAFDDFTAYILPSPNHDIWRLGCYSRFVLGAIEQGVYNSWNFAAKFCTSSAYGPRVNRITMISGVSNAALELSAKTLTKITIKYRSMCTGPSLFGSKLGFTEYWKHFTARVDGARPFRYKCVHSDPTWMKSGALWLHCRGLALAYFWRDTRSSDSWRARRNKVFVQ